jgi:predicted phosphodiesterase
MRYAILSDVHANDEALRAVLDDAHRNGAQQIVCLGDVVGYGPLPAEALARLRAGGALVLAGNHDDAVSGRGATTGFIGLAADAVQRHRAAITPDARAWLAALPYTATLAGGALAAHGDITDPEKFFYVENEEDAAANFAAAEAQLLFVGHTHVPALFLVGGSGTVYKTAPQDFTLEDGKRYIVNPGSVGYPREEGGVCRSSYVLYDSDARTVSFRFLPFAVSGILQRGTAPRRLRRRTLIALLVAVAALAGIGVRFATPEKEVTKIVLRPADRPAPPVATRTLTLPSQARAVRANLKVEEGPVLLQIVFADANGKKSDPILKSVKKSAGGRESVPPGAVTATFTVMKPNAAARPKIRSFSPDVLVK